jgi:hypothetical protein
VGRQRGCRRKGPQGKGAATSESNTEGGAGKRDPRNSNEERNRFERGGEEDKGGSVKEGKPPRGKLADGLLRCKAESEHPTKGGDDRENARKVSGGGEGKTGEEARHRENRATTEPSDPHEKRRSCPRKQERGTTKKARNGVQNDRRNRDGVEEEAKPHSHADRTGDRMERGGDCRGGFLGERLDPEHRHNGRIQGGLKVPGQEAVSKVTEGEPDVRGGTTTPQSPHREAQDRGGADHGLRFNCNGLGHIAKSCKQKPKCHKCGKEGHKIKECRAEKSGTANRQGTEPTTRSDPR